MGTRGILFRTLLAGSLLVMTACAPPVDLNKNLEIVEVTTGWTDAGLTEDGQNKLVPFVQFKLKNGSSQSLPVLQANAMFRPLKEDKEWGSRFQAVVGSEGLAPGATTSVLTLKSDRGVTGTDARTELLKNSHFVDARVQLSAKYGSAQWTKLAEYPVVRQLSAN